MLSRCPSCRPSQTLLTHVDVKILPPNTPSRRKPTSSNTMLMLMSAIEPQRAYEDNERVRLCTSVETTPTCSSLLVFFSIPRLLFSSCVHRYSNSLPFSSLPTSCPSSRWTPLLLSSATPSTHIPSFSNFPSFSPSLPPSFDSLLALVRLISSLLPLPLSFAPFRFLPFLRPLIFCFPRFRLLFRFSGFTFCVTSAPSRLLSSFFTLPSSYPSLSFFPTSICIAFPAILHLTLEDPARWGSTPLSVSDVSLMDIQCGVVVPSLSSAQDPTHLIMVVEIIVRPRCRRIVPQLRGGV